MIGMSRAGLAERCPLFAGAFLSVTLGVALVQSSLLLLITAATMDPPPGLSDAGRMEFADNTSAVVAMLGLVLGIATFLAGFVISSTFAFTVARAAATWPCCGWSVAAAGRCAGSCSARRCCWAGSARPPAYRPAGS
jgi:hypothetical protein